MPNRDEEMIEMLTTADVSQYLVHFKGYENFRVDRFTARPGFVIYLNLNGPERDELIQELAPLLPAGVCFEVRYDHTLGPAVPATYPVAASQLWEERWCR